MWLSLSSLDAVVWYWTQLGLLSAKSSQSQPMQQGTVHRMFKSVVKLRWGGKYVNKHTSWGQATIAIRTNLYFHFCNSSKVKKNIHCFFSNSFSMQYHNNKIWIIWDEKKHLLHQLFCSRRIISWFFSLCLVLCNLLSSFFARFLYSTGFFAVCKLSVRPGKKNICYNEKQRKTSHFSVSIEKLN